MPKISLTDLVDVVTSSGVPKATKIAQIKSLPNYEPKFDFYKPLRDAIQSLHRAGLPKSELDKLKLGLTDKKKLSNYPSAIRGYKKWLGNKSIVWFNPPRGELSEAGVDVIINPELGLEFGATRHIVKLYFKSDKLTKLKIDVIIEAMEVGLRAKTKKGDVMTVVDVRRGKAFFGTGSSAKISSMVGAELAYIAHLWPKL